MNIAVLCSGNGSNLQAIIDAVKSGYIPAKIALVVSDKKDALAIERARKAGIDTLILDKKDFKSREEFDKEVIKSLNDDMVLGSRFTKMRLGNFFLSIIFGIKLNDWFTHCQLIRRESFLNLVPELKSADNTFEILTKTLRKKMRVIEVPVFYDQEDTRYT